MRKLEESFKTLFHGSEAHNRVLQEKLTQQETIIAKLTEVLEDISNRKWFGEVYIYARKALQEIKEIK